MCREKAGFERQGQPEQLERTQRTLERRGCAVGGAEFGVDDRVDGQFVRGDRQQLRLGSRPPLRIVRQDVDQDVGIDQHHHGSPRVWRMISSVVRPASALPRTRRSAVRSRATCVRPRPVLVVGERRRRRQFVNQPATSSTCLAGNLAMADSISATVLTAKNVRAVATPGKPGTRASF